MGDFIAELVPGDEYDDEIQHELGPGEQPEDLPEGFVAVGYVSEDENDPTLAAVRQGENRAEREWLLEHGQPLPDHLKPLTCRTGVHIYVMGRLGCLWCGEE